MISAEQIKAARAMLDWTQETLAEASGLSHATIYNLERGHLSPRSSLEVRRALEIRGFEFFDFTGIVRRTSDIKIFRGKNSSDVFFEDLYSTVKEMNGEIAVICKSQELLAKSLGIENIYDLERLESLSNYASLKCILSETGSALLSVPRSQFKVLPRYHSFMPFYFVYGSKCAIVIAEKDGGFLYVVINCVSQNLAVWDEFLALWSNASLVAVTKSSNRLP